MSATGQRLQLRLFLEGVEIPVVSASIQSQKGSAAVASIQIVANDYATEIKPRTLVHLFAYDAYKGSPPAAQVYVGGAGVKAAKPPLLDPDAKGLIPTEAQANVTREGAADLDNENYKLVFGGEVLGWSYTKSPRSRGIVLQCVDWSSYWDIAFQYQLSGFNFGGGGIKAAFTGAATTVFNDFLEGSGDIVMRLLETPPRSYPELKGSLLGAIVHIIEAIGGCYFGKRAIRGTNDFFSLAEMRLHLTQMVGANPFSARDELRLMKANGFGSLFRRALGGLGQLVTIRQVMQALQRYIFHEIIPVTSPRYIPPASDPNSPQFELVPLSTDRETQPVAKAADLLRTRTLELRSRLEASTTVEEAEAQSNSRGGLQKELLKLAETAGQAATKAKQVGLQGSWSPTPEVFSVQDAGRVLEAAARSFVAVLGAVRYGTTGLFRFPLHPTATSTAILQQLDALAESLLRVQEAQHRRRAQRLASQPDPPQRLITQVYSPDVWMVAPPRCNVLFPELYSQFSYGRNFGAEVSRLLLRTHSAFFGSDILFDGFYMAPSRLLGTRTGKSIAAGRTGKEAPDLADAPAWVVRDLMDHELYTGILPAFERMSDLNLHAIRGGSIEINGLKVGYAQLACNHIFFQYRFKSRELGLSGRFNPYLVLGFPSAVIDKYLANDQLREAGYDVALAAKLANDFKAENNLPADEQRGALEVDASGVRQSIADIVAARPNTHYMGTPEMVSHSLSASGGGTTQVQMGYARTTNEKTEFLGDNLGRPTKARRTGNARIPTVVAALEAPRLGSTGPLGGRILVATDVTDRYQRRQPKGAKGFGSDALLPLFVSDGTFNGRKRRGTRVPVGVEQTAAAYGAEVVALVNSIGSTIAATGNVLVTFRAFQITEEVGSYAAEDVELPPEELTFPPWYGENYRTNQIGSIYSYFFGVGAVTDPTTILGSTTPKSFGEGAGQPLTLNLQFESDMLQQGAGAAVAGQQPVPGFSRTPELQGGGSVGPAGDAGGATQAALGRVEGRSPLRLAIEEVVKAYSAVRSQHYDTPQFVQNYTWRPIASMVDLFGTSDLEIDSAGVAVSGREGFHSRAFGDYDDLRLLVSGGEGPLPQRILGLETTPRELGRDEDSKDAKIAARLDTRKEKRLAVYRYLYALASSRGIVLG